MFKLKILSFVSVCVISVLSPAWSASSVKKLGGVNSSQGTVGVMPAKSVSVNAQRPSSVRSVKQLAATGVKSNKTVSGRANTARLSVGKYLHDSGKNTGVIKPVTVVEPSSVNTVNNYITESINIVDEEIDTDKAITKIEVGEDGKTLNVQRSNIKIPVGSEDALPVASIWIEDLNNGNN